MGGKLCTASKFGIHLSNPRKDNECAKPSSSEFVGLTSCFDVKKLQKKKKKKKKKDREEVDREPESSEKKAKLTRHHLTLEEWILSSPGTDRAQNAVARGKLFVFSQVYKSKGPSSSLCSHIVVEESFPSRRVVMEDGEGCEEDSSSICRSESKRSRKKVSFRLPEETNSIVFYTPSPVETDLNAKITKTMKSPIMINNSL